MNTIGKKLLQEIGDAKMTKLEIIKKLRELKRYDCSYDEGYGCEEYECESGRFLLWKDVAFLLKEITGLDPDDYMMDIFQLKSAEEWSYEGRSIIKGEKCVGKDEDGKAIFHFNQTREIPRGYVHSSRYSNCQLSESNSDYPRTETRHGVTKTVFGGMGGTVYTNEFGEECCPPEDWPDESYAGEFE